MLIFLLTTKKRLVVSLWTFIQTSRKPQRISKKSKPPKTFVDAGVSSKVTAVAELEKKSNSSGAKMFIFLFCT